MRPIDRRGFLSGAGTSAAAAWLTANYPALAVAADSHARLLASGTMPKSFSALSKPDAATIEAITSRIVPSEGEGPGAREAHVVNFIDQGLANNLLQDIEAALRTGLKEFAVAASRADGRDFTQLSAAEQDAFLHTREDTEFFESLQFLTSIGMFALPAYGGNASEQGWQLLGFEDTHAFAPPFGHYDRDYPGFANVAAAYRREGS
jgi:gluconate 2-dehydrogenase gamma chain